MNLSFFPEKAEQFLSEAVRPLRVKFGIDPTRDRLHLGHFVPLRLCRKLQEKGHSIDLILGTLTAQLGDPSGQDQTRPFIGEAEVKENAEKILSQVEKVLLPGFKVHRNHEFVEGMSVPFFLTNLVSQFNVANMLSRDAFKQRQEHNQPIALHEFLVPLLQGWDSVVLKSEVEIGGTDQLFNFQVARKLQESKGLTPQVCVMTPIIHGTDGRKMSKTFGNTIWVDENPVDMFGQVMSIPDTVMEEWIPLLSDMANLPGEHPMSKKKKLAFDIVEQMHGQDAATMARMAFENTVQQRRVPDEIQSVSGGLRSLLDIVIEVRKTSKTQARTLVSQGGVKVDDVSVTDPMVCPPVGSVLRIGKRDFVKVVE